MTPYTEAEKRLARECADKITGGEYSRAFPEWDWAYDGALLAIRKTSEAAGAFVNSWGESTASHGPALVTRTQIAAALQSQSHLEKE